MLLGAFICSSPPYLETGFLREPAAVISGRLAGRKAQDSPCPHAQREGYKCVQPGLELSLGSGCDN